MAFGVTFYNFSKKDNSTKQPSGTGTEYQCTLKRECSVLDPVISLSGLVTSSNHLTLNYCYIPQFSRYYWIDEWVWNDGLWDAHLKMDCLATYKELIGNTPQYILRASAKYDSDVVDTLYPAKVGTYIRMNSAQWAPNDWTYGPETGNGSYVVGIITNNEAVNGTVTYYVMTGGQMAGFRAFMLGEIKAWTSITDISGDVAKAFIDPFQYVVSCIWFPFSVPSTEATEICFGYWKSGLHAGVLQQFTYLRTCVVARPSRTETTIRGNWVYIAPFAEYYLYAEPWGIIPIDSTVITASGLQCNILIDFVTGLAELEIETFTGSEIAHITTLQTHTAQLGVQMQLSQINTNYAGLDIGGGIKGALASAAGALSGMADSIIGGNNSIGNAARAGMAHASISGTSGGMCAIPNSGVVRLYAKYFTPVNEYNQEKGRPLCEVNAPQSLGGYMVVENGDIALPATARECQIVKDYLEGGFYYE